MSILEFAKDHLELILNVLLKWFGQGEIRLLVVRKIREFAVSIQKELFLES